MGALPIYIQNYDLNLEVITCYRCGVIFAIPKFLQQKLLKNHEIFFCPNGHGQAYTGTTEAEKLRKEIDEKDRLFAQELSRRIDAEARESKLRRRIARGICSCCHRSFPNLRRHMETKHPDEKVKKTVLI